MNQSAITVIVNNNAYSLSATDPESMQSIPDADRQPLLALLEAMKRQEAASRELAQRAVARANSSMANPATVSPPRPERLSSGDVDNIMARLIMEERANQKPGITTQTIYTWAAVVAAVIILLVAVF